MDNRWLPMALRVSSFQVTKRKSYGYADSIEEAKAAFRAEDVAWKAEHR